MKPTTVFEGRQAHRAQKSGRTTGEPAPACARACPGLPAAGRNAMRATQIGVIVGLLFLAMVIAYLMQIPHVVK